MTLVISAWRLFIASALGFAVLFSIGWLSQFEREYPRIRLDAAAAHSRGIIEECRNTVRFDMKTALYVYLTIEDFFRPSHFRYVEFLLARLGTSIGLKPVNTLGVGQISRATYASTFEIDRGYPESEIGWVSGLEDHCTNIAVLQAYAVGSDVMCRGNDLRCVTRLACFWHTGRHDSCGERFEDRAYLENLTRAYSRMAKSD